MKKVSWSTLLIALSFTLWGCKGSIDQGLKGDVAATTSSTDSTNIGGGGTTVANFPGCVSGAGVDTQRISIVYEFPLNYLEVFILRDGVEVYSSRNTAKNSFVDSTLQEGQRYIYECGARDSSGQQFIGSNVLEVGTLVVNPPQFSGVVSALNSSGLIANVTWGAPFGGAIVDHYNIYYNPGNDVDWALSPKQTAISTARSMDVPNLGDEVPYAFGVRACTATNVCDSNVAIANLTLPDVGAPRTLGATEVNVVSGNLVITAPWSHDLGAVKRRKVYQRTGAVGGSNIADYTLVKTELIADADLGSPNTALVMANPTTNTTYHFIVRDEDPALNESTNTNVVTILTSDLDPPVFGGITNLVNATPADTAIRVSFSAIGSEANGDSSGATSYLFYATAADLPDVPANPCSVGTLRATLNASAYVSGSLVNYDLTGLSPRKSYKVCVKAKDAIGNVSNTTASLGVVTQDITAPAFDGAQTVLFNNSLQKIEVTWNASAASDILEYRTRIWNSATPGNVTTITKTHAANPTGFSFTSSEFPMASGDIIHVVVNACDNAAPAYNGAANCSSYADSTARIVVLPDIDAPTDFLGINGTAACSPASNGCIKVSWSAPTGGWSEYLGFKIYSVDSNNALTWLRDCACSGNDCVANPLTSCDVAGLGVGQTYNLYVRGHDFAGNLTAANNPWLNKMSGKTGDVSAPIFNAGLTLSNQADGNHASWTLATDNQVDAAIQSGNVITYEFYRKTSSTFSPASITASAPDGLLVYSGTDLSYVDSSAGLTTGSTYYYTVCAKDSSANKLCDGDIKSVLVPDNDAPPGFSGITAAGSCVVSTDGCLRASWNPPANWSDYRGFKVYSVASDDSLTLLKNCSCSASSCPEQPTSCEVTGLDAGRTYNLFVTAFDNAGNQTSQINAYLLRRSGRSSDVTMPVFNSGMALNWQTSPAGAKLNWNQATDNQYASGNFIGYTIYRKLGATFSGASIAAKSPDGVAISATTATNYLDPASGLTEGSTYYYTICAYDSSTPANTICDGVVQSVTAPDVSPPPGFSGIQSAGLCTPNANGCARVSWLAPASWSDYAGFEVYSVASNDSLTFLKNCACTGNNCAANNLTYCEVTIADAARTTDFFVLAYDALGNKTAVVSPYSNRRTTKTGDITAPSFSSFLSASYQASPAGNQIAWSTTFSTDNQYFEMTNAITYKVYRKVGSTFTPLTIANGTPDGSLIATTVSDNYLDPQAGLTGGATTYYTVCSIDTAGNTYCDNNIKSVTLADVTSPTITGLTVNTPITARDTNYTLSWTMSDNSTATGSILVNIRRKASDVPNDYPSLVSDPVYTSGSGMTSFTESYNPAPKIVKYIAYALTATDASNNVSATSYVTVKIANVTITDANYTEYQNTDWVLESGSVVTFQTNTQVTINSLTMNGDSRITHTVCSSPNCYKVNLKILGSATIGPLASIDVTGKGYAWSTSSSSIGYNFAAGYQWAGGTHGGSGGNSSLEPYGSVKDPQTHGGRGGSHFSGKIFPGGGVVVLEVGGTLDIEGTILANGQAFFGLSGWEDLAGSAGGSIKLTANQIINTDGTVTIAATGANSYTDYYAIGGGGGGRIALYYGSISGINVTSYAHVDVRGGAEGYGGGHGQAGTIFYKAATDLDGHVYSNNGTRNGLYGTTGLNFLAGTLNTFDSITAGQNARIYQNINNTLEVDSLNSENGGKFYTPTNGAADYGPWLIYTPATSTVVPGTTLLEY